MRTAIQQGVVTVARRQFVSEPAKVVVAVLAVGAAVALVLLLRGAAHWGVESAVADSQKVRFQRLVG